MFLNLNVLSVKSGHGIIGTQFLLIFVSVYLCAVKGTLDFLQSEHALLCCLYQQEELRAQLPRYQRLAPRPGQVHVAAPPVAAVGSIMPPQQGMLPQQPGMRHPMHGKKMLVMHIGRGFCPKIQT